MGSDGPENSMGHSGDHLRPSRHIRGMVSVANEEFSHQFLTLIARDYNEGIDGPEISWRVSIVLKRF